MSIIKMQTEQVRSLSEKLKSSSLKLDQSIESIISAIRSVSWQGQSKDELLNQLLKVHDQINSLSNCSGFISFHYCFSELSSILKPSP